MDMLNHCSEHTIQGKKLSEESWISKKNQHNSELSKILDPYLDKRSRHQKDPVLDFLFEYYPFRPSHLKRWSPGLSYLLEYSDPNHLPGISELTTDGELARLDLSLFPKKRIASIEWILELLKQSKDRKPLFGCFGMHEWAMVYKTKEIRHDQIPFRLKKDEIDQFVESRPLVCTHFDAFRFFTEDAKPMNRNELNRDSFDQMEQPGCIHTNMDLYKWSFKLYPWITGDTLRDAFINAVEARRIDMQASPYDATEFGLEPIKIETEEGRKIYLEYQTEIYHRSMPIRDRLIGEVENLLDLVLL